MRRGCRNLTVAGAEAAHIIHSGRDPEPEIVPIGRDAVGGAAYHRGMAAPSTEFGTSQLFLSDARLVLAMLNHLRYQALHSTLGLSREQANVLTAVVLLSAADGAYEATRRITGMRPHVSGTDAALGAIALRDASLSTAGPSVRAIPGFGALVAFAILGGFAAPRSAPDRPAAASRRAAAARRRAARAQRTDQALRRRESAREAQRGVAVPLPVRRAGRHHTRSVARCVGGAAIVLVRLEPRWFFAVESCIRVASGSGCASQARGPAPPTLRRDSPLPRSGASRRVAGQSGATALDDDLACQLAP